LVAMTTRVTVSAFLALVFLLTLCAQCRGSVSAAAADGPEAGRPGGQDAPVVSSTAPGLSAGAARPVAWQLSTTSSARPGAPVQGTHPYQVIRLDGGYAFPEVYIHAIRPALPFSTRLDYQVALRTPATFSDPMRTALLAMPGVTPRDDLFARPSVNGGLPEWVSVQYGGFADTYPYVLYGTVSIANSQFDDLRLLKGAFPAEYGDALSGVILLEPRPIVTTETRGGASLDLLRSSFHASAPLRDGGYGISVETSFYDKLLSSITDDAYPGTTSALARLSKRMGSREVSVRLFQAAGGADTRIEPGEDRYTSANTASRTLKRRYEVSVREKRSRAEHTTSCAVFTDSENFNALNGLMGRELGVLNPFSAKVDLGTRSVGLLHKTSMSFVPGHALDVGASVRNEKLTQFTQTEGWNFVPFFNTGRDDVADTSLAHMDQTLRIWRYAFYAQDRCRLADYRVTLGARCDVLNSSASPAVRASVERHLGRCTLRLAGGQYNKFPVGGTFVAGRIAKLTQSYAEPESAVHLLLGADAEVGPVTLTVDLHRQRYSRLVVHDYDGNELRNGRGSLRAVDVTLSTPRDRQNLWAYATASFGKTEVMGVPTDWDQTLVAKVVCFGRPRPDLELTTRVFYGSGLAYTPLLGRTALVDPAGATVTDAVGNEAYTPVWGDENSGRLPAQFRLDLRIATTRSLFARRVRFFLDGLNLTNHRNISGVDYLDYYSRVVYRTNVPRAANLGVEVYF
ncbi:MAG: TonB-dependent receptor, partial [Candidatus Eisenbacteria bacterium]|nr:TonB-dependent receptor [Candidatus Eisenbacteria bacterium]